MNHRMTIAQICGAVESPLFDRKSARIDAKTLAIHLIAFANADGGMIAVGDLDQAQFWPERILAHELSVDGDEIAALDQIDKFGERCAGFDKRMDLHVPAYTATCARRAGKFT